MQRIALALLLAAILASCSSPTPRQVAEAPDLCAKYTDPTTVARCRLYTGPQAWRWVPLPGRSANLDTQLRCAPFRWNSGPYERCLSGAGPQLALSSPRTVVPAPQAGPTTAPGAVLAPPAAEPADRITRQEPPPQQRAAAPAVRQPPVALEVRPVERTYKEPAAPPKPVVTPGCAENGSCYGDISSYTGRPKTVRVRGYFRKDGTYVRGHYRSRPRR